MRWAVARSLLREEALQKEVSAVQKKVSAAFSTTSKASAPNKNDTPTRTLSSAPLPQRKESLESNINIVTSTVPGKVENILKGSLDSIPSPSPSIKIQIMCGKVCLRCKGNLLIALLPQVNSSTNNLNFH